MDIRERVNAYTLEVESGEIRCRKKQCPRCKALTEDFRVREVRPRGFRAVVDGLVERLKSYAVRWTCGLCKERFTDLPEFALAHKRYVKQTVLPLAEKYVEEDVTTYEGVVGCIGYPAPEPKPRWELSREKQEEQDRMEYPRLAPSTLWHWESYLGEVAEACHWARDRIWKKDPSIRVDVEVSGVSPRKYRSEKRRRVLERAKALLRTDREHRRLFGVDLLPGFAIGELRA